MTSARIALTRLSMTQVWPTNLETYEHISIVFQGVRGAVSVDINAQRLGRIDIDDETAEFEITPHLALHDAVVCV